MNSATFASKTQGTVQYNAEKEGLITVSDVCDVLTTDGPLMTAYERFVTLNDKVRRLLEMRKPLQQISIKVLVFYTYNDTTVSRADKARLYGSLME